MWSGYSIAKLFFLLLLVEASLGRFMIIPKGVKLYHPPSALELYLQGNSTARKIHHRPSLSEYLKAWNMINVTSGHDSRYPNGNVTIRWDIMNQTHDSYTANVTIFNYLKNHDIEGPWELEWTWSRDDIILSTLGAKSRQDVNVPVGDDSIVTVVDLPPQTGQIVPNCCKGGLIHSWFKEADLAKSSSSFQISVARGDIEYPPQPFFVGFTTPGWNYSCDHFEEVTNTPGYLNTWRVNCRDRGVRKQRRSKRSGLT